MNLAMQKLLRREDSNLFLTIILFQNSEKFINIYLEQIEIIE